ncbi:MAG: hypothetical protein HRU15_17675 [Planctomycetes bacterium]|nr:hypothetical protein [Planctomycetota bacterium]
MQRLMDQAKKSPPLIEQFAPDLSQDSADLIMRCLEKDPAKRPQSMHELKAAISQLSAYGEWNQATAKRLHDEQHTSSIRIKPEPAAKSIKHSARIRFG